MSHIYVHVPFCDSICSYCDFFRVPTNHDLVSKYLTALEKEVNSYSIGDIKTIYFGGGTPSSLKADDLDKLLSIFDPFTKEIDEYSFEANPENIDREKLMILKRHGVNRISLGVQTLDDNLLKLLNRKHESKDVLKVIEMIHECGIHNISIDMMYALPFQSVEMFKAHLKEVCSWPITHISIYSLTIEEHSEFARKHIEALDNDDEGQMYEVGCAILEENGFEHYEVANFARDKAYSAHNLGYWDYDSYYGFGPGAVGFINDIRYENTHNLIDYFEGKYRENEEKADLENQMFEYIMVGLRKTKGININSFEDKFKVKMNDVYSDATTKNMKLGYLEIVDGMLRTTNLGMQFLHTILIDFIKD